MDVTIVFSKDLFYLCIHFVTALEIIPSRLQFPSAVPEVLSPELPSYMNLLCLMSSHSKHLRCSVVTSIVTVPIFAHKAVDCLGTETPASVSLSADL